MLKGVCVGAGYFSRFQYEAWSRIPEVTISAVCNRDEEKGKEMAAEFGIPSFYLSVAEMLDKEQPDFMDIITPPETHLLFCREAYKRKVNVIVQKPLAPTLRQQA
jgi:D-apiose dehydrogenase